MNYAVIKKFDIANGPGVRVSLFVSGCRHHCKNCFNQEAWSFSYGRPFTEEVREEILSTLSADYIEGLSLLGGEPFEPENQEGLLLLAEELKRRFPQKTLWCYTGFLFDEELLAGKVGNPETVRRLLACTDVLVDGKFVEEQKNISLAFRGSENQRIIDVPQSMASGKTILLSRYHSEMCEKRKAK